MLDELRRLSEDVTRYYEEVDRRVAATGMDGIVGLLMLSHQIEAALAIVPAGELDDMVAELRSLLERLVGVDAQLRRVRALKTKLVGESETA